MRFVRISKAKQLCGGKTCRHLTNCPPQLQINVFVSDVTFVIVILYVSLGGGLSDDCTDPGAGLHLVNQHFICNAICFAFLLKDMAVSFSICDCIIIGNRYVKYSVLAPFVQY